MINRNNNSINQNQNVGYRNVNTNHPLVNNAQDYYIYSKFLSISSEDRDIIKYPYSYAFEIELPEDYANVAKMSLYNWNFPSNYNTFSVVNRNVTMTFKINNPYNPNDHNLEDPLQLAIYEALYSNRCKNYIIFIEEGFYNPTQMTTELTNRFNSCVTEYIIHYFTNNGYQDLIANFQGYQEFVIVYNNVGQKIWFGNTSSGFILTNSTAALISKGSDPLQNCAGNYGKIPDWSNWGLPGNLGFTRCDIDSATTSNINDARFFYGNVYPGDNGFWLLPNPSLPGAQIHYLIPPYKINLMGPSYFCLEIAGYNCIDETSPYTLNEFTRQTNQTNSIVNGCFAKINILSTPTSEYYDHSKQPYKYFYPPAERVRKLNIRLRYHDGSPVDFGVFNFSFMIEFELLVPQINRQVNIVNYTNMVIS